MKYFLKSENMSDLSKIFWTFLVSESFSEISPIHRDEKASSLHEIIIYIFILGKSLPCISTSS